MPSPTTVRGLLGHLPRGADLPAVNKRSSPPPVLLPTYLSLRVISAARVGGGGARGGAGGRKSLRDGKSEVRGGRREIQGRKGNEAQHNRGGAGDNRGDRDDGYGNEREEKND